MEVQKKKENEGGREESEDERRVSFLFEFCTSESGKQALVYEHIVIHRHTRNENLPENM